MALGSPGQQETVATPETTNIENSRFDSRSRHIRNIMDSDSSRDACKSRIASKLLYIFLFLTETVKIFAQ
jgi:hypothetical protein